MSKLKNLWERFLVLFAVVIAIGVPLGILFASVYLVRLAWRLGGEG